MCQQDPYYVARRVAGGVLTLHGRVTFNGMLLKLELDAHTLLIFPDGRTLVQGTDDEAVARTLYARFIGG